MVSWSSTFVFFPSIFGLIDSSWWLYNSWCDRSRFVSLLSSQFCDLTFFFIKFMEHDHFELLLEKNRTESVWSLSLSFADGSWCEEEEEDEGEKEKKEEFFKPNKRITLLILKMASVFGSVYLYCAISHVQLQRSQFFILWHTKAPSIVLTHSPNKQILSFFLLIRYVGVTVTPMHPNESLQNYW